MTTTHLIPVERGVSVSLIEAETTLVPIKPICELLGISWQVQHRKLMEQPDRWGVTIMVMPSASGAQETTCLPAREVVAWLWTISSAKIAPAAVDRLLALRTRLDAALEAHGRERVARLEHRIAVLTGELVGRKPSWGKLIAWSQAGMTDADMLRAASAARWRTREALADLRTAGLIGPPAHDLTPMERLMGVVGDA